MLKILLLLSGWLMVAVAEAQLLGRKVEGLGELTHRPRPGLLIQQGRQHRSCETEVGRQGGGPCKGTLPTTEGETKVIIILPF